MRWLCVFIVAVLSFSGLEPAVAQQQSALPSEIRANLTDAQLKEFRRQQLGIQVDTRTRTDITANTYTWLLPNTPVLTTTGGKTVSTKQVRKWELYHGFQEITEPEFFRIAGYPRAARKAEEWRTREWLLPVGILSAAALTGGIIGASNCSPRCSDGQQALYGLGIGLGFGGVLFGAVGYKRNMYVHWAPLSKARAVASDYNRSLYEKLAGKGATAGTETFQESGYLPVTTTNVGETVEETLSLPSGARKVTSSEVESLQKGDVIISVNGADLKQEGSLKQVVKRHSPGDTVQLEILREGKNKTVSVTLGGSIGG